jgi:hypothetical protein
VTLLVAQRVGPAGRVVVHRLRSGID